MRPMQHKPQGCQILLLDLLPRKLALRRKGGYLLQLPRGGYHRAMLEVSALGVTDRLHHRVEHTFPHSLLRHFIDP